MASMPRPQSAPSLAGSAARTARSLNSDSVFDKKARELIEAASASESEVESDGAATAGAPSSVTSSVTTPEKNDELDVDLNEYLASNEEDDSSTDDTADDLSEEAEIEMNSFEKKWEKFQQMFQQMCQMTAKAAQQREVRYEATLDLKNDGRYEDDATPLQKAEIRKLNISRRVSEHEEGEIPSAYDEDAVIDTEGLLNLCRHVDDDEDDAGGEGVSNKDIVVQFLMAHLKSVAKLMKLERYEALHKDDKRHKKGKGHKRRKKHPTEGKHPTESKPAPEAAVSSASREQRFRRSFRAAKLLSHVLGSLAYHAPAEKILKSALGTLLRMFNVPPPVSGRSLHMLCFALKGLWKERPDLFSDGTRKLAFKYILSHIYDHNVCAFLGEMLADPNTAGPLLMQDRGVLFFKQLIRRGVQSAMHLKGLYIFFKFHIIEQFERAERAAAVSGMTMQLASLRHLGDAMHAAMSAPGLLDPVCAAMAPLAVSDQDPDAAAEASATCAEILSVLLLWMRESSLDSRHGEVRVVAISRASDVHIKAYLEWAKNTAVLLSDTEKAYLKEHFPNIGIHKRRKRKKSERHSPHSPSASGKKKRKKKKHNHDEDPANALNSNALSNNALNKSIPRPPVVHQPQHLVLRVDPQVLSALRLIAGIVVSRDSSLQRVLLGSAPGVAHCLELSLMRVVIRIFLQHPWNNIVHSVVSRIALAVLDAGNDKMPKDPANDPLVKLSSDLILRCGFPDLFVTLLEHGITPHKEGEVMNVSAIPQKVRMHCKDSLSTGKGFPTIGRRPDFGGQLFQMAHACALLSRAQVAWQNHHIWRRFVCNRLPDIASSFSALQPALHIFLFGRLRDDCIEATSSPGASAGAAHAADAGADTGADGGDKYSELMELLYKTPDYPSRISASDTESKPSVVSATLDGALLYCREDSADPYVILDDPAAADKGGDTPRVSGRLIFCPSPSIMRMKLEAIKTFVRDSHTGEDEEDDTQSAAPIYALLAMARARSGTDSADDGKDAASVDKVEARKTYLEVLAEGKDRRVVVQSYTLSVLTQKEVRVM